MGIHERGLRAIPCHGRGRRTMCAKLPLTRAIHTVSLMFTPLSDDIHTAVVSLCELHVHNPTFVQSSR
eukprot:16056362-Heterocapsa_arctica.AAC.1